MDERRRVRLIDGGREIGVTIGGIEQCLPVVEWQEVAGRVLWLAVPDGGRRCGTCAAWSMRSDQATDQCVGQCRLEAPGERGWPETKSEDWCLAGWCGKAAVGPGPEALVQAEAGCIGFDYGYIRDYPEAAGRWLEQAWAQRHSAPESFRSVLDDPLKGHTTRMMPLVSETEPCCEDVLQWVSQFSGHDNDVEDDALWRSIVEYREETAAVVASEDVRRALPLDHPWVVRAIVDLVQR